MDKRTVKVGTKWLHIVRQPQESTKKTQMWLVYTADKTVLLGLVKWFGRWHQYSFFPNGETVYEKQCLRDIADFVEDLTKLHMGGVKERRNTSEHFNDIANGRD